MAKTYTHPHWDTYVIDKSIYTPLDRETLPLHRPIFFCRAQKGPVGVPVWCVDSTAANRNFGIGTFDENTEWYSREALYMNNLFPRQGCFITRMVSADAQFGSLVLELRVKAVEVPQYQKDVNGQFILDPNTNERMPLLDNGIPVTEPGYELKWQTRPLQLTGNRKESITNLKPTTYGTGPGSYTIYPILAYQASSMGGYSDDIGVKFFVDTDNMDTPLANELGCIPYTFGLVEKTYGQDTVSAIQSNFQNQFENVILKPNQTDQRVARNVSFDDVMGNEYDGVLPMNIHLYSENVEAIGKLIQEVEYDDETLFSPYMVNLAEPYNIEGVPYSHVVLSDDDDAIYLNDTRILYMEGGEDGDISDKSIEALTVQYLDDLVYPELMEQPRYPFTHMYDTGVRINTKKSMIRFLGKHDAFKLVLSTADVSMERFNTKAEDLSMGSALYAACLLQPESTIKGTEVCRAEIYQQAGHLATGTYRGIIPSTLDVLIKKARWHSTNSITGQWGGLPNSEITIFKDWNWTPCDSDHRQRAWDSGLNYFQYYDMTSIHWPAMRTVYRYDTSVLTSALFTDIVVYTKHIARYNWSRFAGLEIDFALLADRATKAVTGDMSTMLNGMINFDVAFSQSEEEARIGYISHCTINLYGNPQQRVWTIDINCYRNGYNPEEEA